MKVIDKQFTQCSAMGVRQMVDFLRGKGYNVGKKLVRRLMNLMDLRAIYPMKSLSKGGWIKYRMPYLLRNLLIDQTKFGVLILHRRYHQGIDHQIPAARYAAAIAA